jgi:hypothetical protein
MLRTILTALTLLVVALAVPVVAWSQTEEEATEQAEPAKHRFMVVRTFPPGALEGLDEAGKQQVVANNDANGVRWIRSYASADLTKTFCVYEGPSEEAIRRAAEANQIPIDDVIEIPVDLTP